ncbi:uncharacterized protein LOC130656782 [Hydractinia symbiolongicarpus]|uniref:uncharacterized protein LOC130656782 n=1 Tax=Hydractinia symbiolongicarpus TaxID=13093 RepID=UPI002551686C|nr:uncharacterized protein LOC130656782 [Hydractinia symbiolongicarpus]
MLLTRILLSKAGWRPRSLSTPGRQWIGKNRRYRHITKGMRKTQRNRIALAEKVEQMIEFPYLTLEEDNILFREEQNEMERQRLKYQKRILGYDVFGLGLGKPSFLDHLMVSDTRRYKANDEID